MPCADALQFNPLTSQCDYAANVKCTYGGSPIATLPPGILELKIVYILNNNSALVRLESLTVKSCVYIRMC